MIFLSMFLSSQTVWLCIFTTHLKFLETHNYWLAQLVYVSFEFRDRIKIHIKMFRNFSKKTLVSGFGSKQPLQQQSTPAYFIGPVFSMVWFCEMFLFCLLNLSLFSCLAVNNCIGNMLDFPKFCMWLKVFSINQNVGLFKLQYPRNKLY